MKYTREQYFRIWLAGIDGIGAITFARLIERYGSAEAVWEQFGDDMKFVGNVVYQKMRESHNRDKASEMVEVIEKCGAQVVFYDDPQYPKLLREIADPPSLLYVRGQSDISDEMCFSIVGTRSPTTYGLRMSRQFSSDLAGYGVTIVSGFARGIDSAAHQGAVDAGGRTIAILGCGVDMVYPPENVELFDKLLEADGSIVSEFPPGSQPIYWHFPMRNRIISGMSRGVLMVEGLKKSGALHTVSSAVEQNREVFVLPGPIDSPKSEVNHQLARDGARIVTSALEILEDLKAQIEPRLTSESVANKKESAKSRKNSTKLEKTKSSGQNSTPKSEEPIIAPETEPTNLSDEEALVYKAHKSGMKAVDRIVELTGLSAARVNTVLTTLQMKGIII